MITYLISQKGRITYAISDNYAIIKVDSYDSVAPFAFDSYNLLTLDNATTLIKEVFSKNQNSYSCIN